MREIVKKIKEMGCGDSHCFISGATGGMCTNGRCHCLDSIPLNDRIKIREAFKSYIKLISYYKRIIELYKISDKNNIGVIDE